MSIELLPSLEQRVADPIRAVPAHLMFVERTQEKPYAYVGKRGHFK